MLPLLSSSRFTLPRLYINPQIVSVRFNGRKTAHSDPQNDQIRRALYPSNIRNKETPTGTWRPDVTRALRRAIPSKQAHETIERAWLLHERHVRWKRNAESERKFDCMRKAMAELENVDPALFKEANRPDDPRRRSDADASTMKFFKTVERKAMEGRLPGLFPREMRAPTDTPPRSGWDYDWKSPSISSASS